MNFKELLLQAKFGDRTATTELLMLYQPLLLKESIIDGILDEDLYQELCIFCVIFYTSKVFIRFIYSSFTNDSFIYYVITLSFTILV